MTMTTTKEGKSKTRTKNRTVWANKHIVTPADDDVGNNSIAAKQPYEYRKQQLQNN
jgi:hypothetical protein